MRSRLSRFRLSPAFPISLIALFVALGGVGYAAATIGTNDIENGAVTKKKIHKNAVTTKKIKNHTIKKVDLAFDLTGVQGPQGPAGPAGPSNVGGAVIQTDHVGTVATRSGTLGDPNDPPAAVVLAASDEFAWVLACPDTPAVSALAVVNVSAGNDSHISLGDGQDTNDNFDQGADNAIPIAVAGGTDHGNQSPQTLIYGANGSTQWGVGGALNEPDSGFGGVDCVGSVNILAG
jgi:hypothetical protein